MHRVIAALLVLIGLLAARAEPPDNRNGATWYGRAFERFPSVTDEEWEFVNRYRAHPGGVRQLLIPFARPSGRACIIEGSGEP